MQNHSENAASRPLEQGAIVDLYTNNVNQLPAFVDFHVYLIDNTSNNTEQTGCNMAHQKLSFLLVSVLLALFFTSGNALADSVYKWVDEDGNIHYSQKPPEGKDSEVINTRKPRSFGYGQHDDSNNAQTSQADQATEQADDQTKEQPAQKPEETFKKDPELCKKAKEYKAVLLRNPIVRKNNKALTLDEKNEEMRKANEIIQMHCDGEEGSQ